ncbi:unnamed protein product, partial [Oikopleura dioica]
VKKEEPEENVTSIFPKITVCLNTMHSMRKLFRSYPQILGPVRIRFAYQLGPLERDQREIGAYPI